MKYRYEQMLIEGTRLLGLKPDGRSNSYGSYVRIVDTGETCYACANGQFFDHEETQRLVDAVTKKMLAGHHPTEAFNWHPIEFPCSEAGVDYGHFIYGNPALRFTIHFWGDSSYVRQIEWIMRHEAPES